MNDLTAKYLHLVYSPDNRVFKNWSKELDELEKKSIRVELRRLGMWDTVPHSVLVEADDER